MQSSLQRFSVVRCVARNDDAEVHEVVVRGPASFARTFALKTLTPRAAGDPAKVQSFLESAALLAKIDHHNVVAALEVGVDDGRPFLVTEWIDGLTLRDLLTRSPRLPVETALAIGVQLCAAADAAHRLVDETGAPLGLVHRDISPTNVLVARSGAVKLADFGIATTASRIQTTEEGVVRGKLQYLSPEQCRGEPLDARSDVFAIGVVLYEMLAGELPHAPLDGYALARAIVDDPPRDPRDRRPDLPPELGAIVLACLALDKAERTPSARHLHDALTAIATARGLSALPSALSTMLVEACRGGPADGSRTGPSIRSPETTPVRAPGSRSDAVTGRSRAGVWLAAAVAVVVVVAVASLSRSPAVVPLRATEGILSGASDSTARASAPPPRATASDPGGTGATVPVEASASAVTSAPRGERASRRAPTSPPAPRSAPPVDLDSPNPP